MNGKDGFVYYDRARGALIAERIDASAFLSWSYNTGLGRLTTDLLFTQRWFSSLYGWLHKQAWTKRKIAPFVSRHNVNMEESVRPLEDFGSFNDFFTREIDLSKRPIHPDLRVCICPADGRVLAYPVVEADKTFRIKRGSFNLRTFLCNDALAEKFTRGSMVIVRLYLSDYHHFHFPDSGIPGKPASLQGKYYAVGPYAVRSLAPLYAENHRVLTLIDSDHFGQIAMVEIGALTVGSIQQRFQPEARVAKGDRKGFFELGGSMIVLLFQKRTIQLDNDLCSNTKDEVETYVRLGDAIGRTRSVPRRRANDREE